MLLLGEEFLHSSIVRLASVYAQEGLDVASRLLPGRYSDQGKSIELAWIGSFIQGFQLQRARILIQSTRNLVPTRTLRLFEIERSIIKARFVSLLFVLIGSSHRSRVT